MDVRVYQYTTGDRFRLPIAQADTIQELAGIVGPWCTAVIIDGWIRKNGLPASKLGKRLVVTVGDFRQWVKENKVKIFRIA